MKNFFKVLYIKLTLLRITFFKNLVTFAFIFALICIALIVSGAINSDTSILGWLFYDLSRAFDNLWTNLNCKNIIAAFSPIITTLLSIYLFATRFKSIGLSDIKSKKIKIMIIRCNLVLTDNGFLVSRDKASKYKTDETENTTSQNIVNNFVNAINETAAVIKADVDVTTSDKEILEKANAPIENQVMDDKPDSYYKSIRYYLTMLGSITFNAIKNVVTYPKKLSAKYTQHKLNKIENAINNNTKTDNNTNVDAEKETATNADVNASIIPNVTIVPTVTVVDQVSQPVKTDGNTDIVDAINKNADAQADVVANVINNLAGTVNTANNVVNKNANNVAAKVSKPKKANSAAALLAKLNGNK